MVKFAATKMVKGSCSLVLSLGLIFLVIFSSCSPKADLSFDKPKNLLPEDSMVLVLKELMVLENHVQSTYPGNFMQNGMGKTGDELLKKYHISFPRFTQSFRYYASDQDKMEQIYTTIQDSLKKELIQLQNQEPI